MNGLLLESPQQYQANVDARVQNVLTENRSWKDKYKGLMALLEGNDPKQAKIAKATLLIMENQAKVMQNIKKNPLLEATFNANLNTLVPKVIDLVRIFYPNLIANELVDIQPMDRQNGEVFIVKPVFTSTAAGVTAQQEVFRNITDGTYASESVIVALGTGDGE
jgi:hypothetical protein